MIVKCGQDKDLLLLRRQREGRGHDNLGGMNLNPIDNASLGVNRLQSTKLLCRFGIHELQLDAEAIYQKFVKIIENTNLTIAPYEVEETEDRQLDPRAGTVAFGSAFHGWAFTLPQFARLYAKKFNTSEDFFLTKFWGDNYYDKETKKWQTSPQVEGRPPLKRAFCEYIMEPIVKLSKALHDNDEEAYTKLLSNLGITLLAEDKTFSGRDLIRRCFQKWMMAADALLEMIVRHLPSPKQAQVYRGPYLYEGPQDDIYAKAIRECDPNGPLMIYVSKMVPGDKGRLYCFGRVFSGTIMAGQKVRILGANYDPQTKVDQYYKNVTRTVLMMGRFTQQVSQVPCGNTVGLIGIDQFVVKNATVTGEKDAAAYTIRCMRYSVSPVVRVAVSPKNPADLPKLIEGLNLMVKTDGLVQVTKEENGEHVVAGCGELHLEICLHDLVENYAKIEITTSEPVVSYKETVTTTGSTRCLSKSQNKLNRVIGYAQPLEPEIVSEVEEGRLGKQVDAKAVAHTLMSKFNWDSNDAKKVWVFGPESTGTSVLVDQTKAAVYLTETRSSFEHAFEWVTRQGALADQEMRGVRINITDVMLHSDPAHRGDGQIVPMARRMYYAAQLTAGPRLEEPIYKVSITCPTAAIGGVYSCLGQRRGIVANQEPVTGTPLTVVTANLPVAESFGFIAHLRSATSGQAFAQCIFDHWEVVNQDPFDESSRVSQVIKKIRTRRGLPEAIPSLDHFLDKL